MSILKTIFGQNAQGEDGIQVLKTKLNIQLRNQDYDRDSNEPEYSWKQVFKYAAYPFPLSGTATLLKRSFAAVKNTYKEVNWRNTPPESPKL